MVHYLQYLPESTGTDNLHYLKSITDVVSHQGFVVILTIVKYLLVLC